jgi:Polysaccharide lyase
LSRGFRLPAAIDPEVPLPAARWSSALAGALATACLFAAPALADICGNPGYSYAGVLSAKRTAGVSAAITAPVAPTVESGDVSGWVGVGRAAVPGKRGMLRAGLLAGADGQIRLYYEMRRATGWVRHLGPAVQAGESHRLRVARVPNHKKRWKIVIDGHFVNSFRMSDQPRKFRAMATAESWDGGTSVCNRFHYSFGAVRVKKHGHWHRLASPAVIEDPGYAVVQQPVARFVAANVDDVPPAHERGRFTGNWETGDSSQWTANQWNRAAPLSEQFAVETNVVREGTYAAKFTVRPGDKFESTSGERSEVYWGGSDESDGQDYWYSWSTLFPTDWTAPAGWGYFIQWHADFLATTPPIAFNAREDSVVIQVNTGPLNSSQTTGTVRYTLPLLDTLNKGLWNDFVAHIHWSSGNDGAITVWHRVEGETSYTKVLNATGFPTLQVGPDGVPASNYLKLGLYRSTDTKVSSLYQDGFKRWISADPPPELGTPS